MIKLKKQKGITLVALIITIVVLLILAAVTIGAVKDSDIIGYAQNAAGGYNQARENELDIIKDYENIIGSYLSEKINEYGFYYNKEYVTRGYRWENDIIKIKFLEDGKVYIYSWQDTNFVEGESTSFVDYLGVEALTIDYLEYNKEYKGICSNDAQCVYVINSKGQNTAYFIIDKNVKFENKKVSIGENMIYEFLEDGKSFSLGGKIFEIEE